MNAATRWLAAGTLAVLCAAAGVLFASWISPRAVPVQTPVPVHVAVTTTATAHPDAGPAPVVTPGINLAAHSTQDPTSIWVVVNKQRPLEMQAYVPSDLTKLGIPGSSGAQLRKQAAAALKKMYKAANKAGAPFLVSSAYRSYSVQKSLFAQYAANRGAKKAETFSARPGYSEHQAGLALDVYDPAGCRAQQCYANTASGRWLVKHAADYGFIERYPKGFTDVTGYIWEPWHWRYVGVELAQYMRDQQIATLEQVFDLPAAPNYT